MVSDCKTHFACNTNNTVFLKFALLFIYLLFAPQITSDCYAQIKGGQGKSPITPNIAELINLSLQEGEVLMEKGRHRAAQKKFLYALQLAERANLVKLIAKSNYHICVTLNLQKKYVDAIGRCFSASENIALHNNVELWTNSMFEVIEAYKALKEKETADFYYQKLFDFYWENGQIGELALFYYKKAVNFHKQKNYSGALKLFKTAHNLFQKDNDKLNIFNCEDKLGEIYTTIEKPEDALPYNKSALAFARALEDTSSIARLSYRTADNYMNIGEYNQATDFFKQSIGAMDLMGESEGNLDMLNNLATMHYMQEEYDKAGQYIDRALKLAAKHPNRLYCKNVYINAANIYTKLNKPTKGVNILADYITQMDSVSLYINAPEETRDAIEVMQEQHGKETAQKDITIDDLEQDAAQKAAEAKFYKIIGFVVLISLLLMLALAYSRYRLQRRSNAMLKQKNEEIADQFEKLERTNKALEDFAFIASHDLKEPIRMIGSYTSLLERRYSDKFDRDAFDFIRFIKEAVNRLHGLLNDIFNYSVVSKGENIEIEQVDVNDAVYEALYNLKTEIDDNQIEVDIASLPAIKANKTQMIQLFQNLIANAIKFRGEQSPYINIEYTNRPDKHVFAVKDNGIGIPEEYHKKIFEAFKRLNRRDEYKGNGIGLAICSKIISRYQGEIWVDSREGEGSSFYFSLPKNLSVNGVYKLPTSA